MMVVTFIVAITTIPLSINLNAATFPGQEKALTIRAAQPIETGSQAGMRYTLRGNQIHFPNFSFLNCDETTMCFEINANRKYTLSGNLQLQEDQICHRLPTHVASTFGFSFQHIRGWQTSIQYSFLDNGIESTGNVNLNRNFLPLDLSLNYAADRFSFGLAAENFMNMQWNLNKLSTQSRMRDAETPIGWDLYFPELPYALTASVSILF